MLRQRFVFCLVILALFGATVTAAQRSMTSRPAAPQGLDGRVATIGHRLAVANLGWCRDREWLPGVILGVEEPSAAIRAVRGEIGPTVLALVHGGPAERAGLARNDLIESADGELMPRVTAIPRGGFEGMASVRDAFDTAFADGAAQLGIRRGNFRHSLRIDSERGCASRFLIISARGLNAYADGRHVQVTSAIAEYVADDGELAAVLAHEFAHNILRHRARLDAAGVARGFFGNFGRNARLIRETEDEADRLSVWLLDRAGYDPAATIRFWSRFGRRGLNIIGSPTHGGWRGRVARFEVELAAIRATPAAERPLRPIFLPPVDED